MKTTVVVRYFAGIAEVAGVAEDRLEIDGEVRLSDVITELIGRHGQDFGQNLRMCAMLSQGQRLAEDDNISYAEYVEIDVLPPFAGG